MRYNRPEVIYLLKCIAIGQIISIEVHGDKEVSPNRSLINFNRSNRTNVINLIESELKTIANSALRISLKNLITLTIEKLRTWLVDFLPRIDANIFTLISK